MQQANITEKNSRSSGTKGATADLRSKVQVLAAVKKKNK
jgi:hypothetical protein